MDVKKALSDGFAKLLQNPRVLALATHPSVMQAAMSVMNLRGEVASKATAASLSAARSLDLATRSEVVELRRTVRQLQEKISRMETDQRRAQGLSIDEDDE